MANKGAVTYNQSHVQVADKAGTTWVDITGVVSLEPSITANSEPINADGMIYATAYEAVTGEGDLVTIDVSPAIMAALNGGEVTSVGSTSPAETWELASDYVAPAIQVAEWSANIDKVHNPTITGLRMVFPNATSAPGTRSGGQNSVGEWTFPLTFNGTDTSPIVRYEWLTAEPTFTGGTMNMTIS